MATHGRHVLMMTTWCDLGRPFTSSSGSKDEAGSGPWDPYKLIQIQMQAPMQAQNTNTSMDTNPQTNTGTLIHANSTVHLYMQIQIHM